MNIIKKILGVIWMLAGPVIIYFLINGAFTHIDSNGTKEINNPVIWIIIITIFTPIAIGLFIFGWYAVKGEYEQLPTESSTL